MIEVVGKDESLKKQVTCRNCASVLKYMPCDVKKEVHHDYSGGIDTYHYIKCPDCSQRVTVRSY